MPDFTRPEYASYVELCRSLRLERDLVPGDWIWDLDRAGLTGGKPLPDPIQAWRFGPAYMEDRFGPIVWLPQLSDWLDMLRRERRWIAFAFTNGKVDAEAGTVPEARALFTVLQQPTCEEAAARLAIATNTVKAP